MNKVFSRKLGVILSIVTIGLFLLSILIFGLTKKYFPFKGIRDNNFNIPNSELITSKDYINNNEIIDFKNEDKKYIYITFDNPNNIKVEVSGYIDEQIKDVGEASDLKKDNLYYYTFGFDYFGINKLKLSFAEQDNISNLKIYKMV